MTEIAVTDTHALIWWLADDRRRLGPRARRFFEDVDAGRAVVCIPALVLVELDEAIVAGDVSLAEPFDTFVRRLLLTPSRYRVVPLGPDVILAASTLHGIPERGDRLIAATAVALQIPLVTSDPQIAAAASLDVLW